MLPVRPVACSPRNRGSRLSGFEESEALHPRQSHRVARHPVPDGRSSWQTAGGRTYQCVVRKIVVTAQRGSRTKTEDLCGAPGRCYQDVLLSPGFPARFSHRLSHSVGDTGLPIDTVE